MTIIHLTFDRAGELYGRLFADWLHVHFLIRTVLLLFAIWLVIYVAAQLFQYGVGPLLLLFFYHVILRAWNFLVIETLQEWIYIHYYSQDRPNFNTLYLRLCDKVKRNRQILKYTKYTGILRRGKVRRFSMQMMLVCGTMATLWIGAFGLHQEYAAPAMAIVDVAAEQNYVDYQPSEDATEYDTPYDAVDVSDLDYFTHWTDADIPVDPWDAYANAIFTLNEQGRPGARLRNGPGVADTTIIEILWDDDQLLFLNAAIPDVDVDGMYWLHVQTPSGADGYISSQLIDMLNVWAISGN